MMLKMQNTFFRGGKLLDRNLNMTRMVLGAKMPGFNFSSVPDGDNTHLIPPEMMKREKQMYQEKVSEKEKKVKEATRLASIQLQKEYNENENAWWNRLANMDIPEYKLMPMGYIKKYYSYVTNLQRYRGDFQLEENRSINDYYAQIKHLKTLLTEEQRNLLLAEFEKAYIPDIVTMKDLEREEGDYMRR